MTRYKRSGNTQKHRKMPMEATSWEDLKNSLGNSDSPDTNNNGGSEKKSEFRSDEIVPHSNSNTNKQPYFHSDGRSNNKTSPNPKKNFSNQRNFHFDDKSNNMTSPNSNKNFKNQRNFHSDYRGNNRTFQNPKSNFNKQRDFSFGNRGNNEAFQYSRSSFNNQKNFNNRGNNRTFSNSNNKFNKQQNFHLDDSGSQSRSNIGKKRKFNEDEDPSGNILDDCNFEDANDFIGENPILNKSHPNKRQKRSFKEQFAGDETDNARHVNATGFTENNQCLDKSDEYTPSVMSKRQMRKQKRMMKLEERKRSLDAGEVKGEEANTKIHKSSLFSCPWDNTDAAGDNSAKEDIGKQQQSSGSVGALSKKQLKKQKQMQKDKADSINKPSEDMTENQDEAPLSKKQIKSAKRKGEWLQQLKSKRQKLRQNKQNKSNPQEQHETESKLSAETSENQAEQEDHSLLSDNSEQMENASNIERSSLVSASLSKRQKKKLKNKINSEEQHEMESKLSAETSESQSKQEDHNNSEQIDNAVGIESSFLATASLSKRQQKKLKKQQKFQQKQKDYEDSKSLFSIDNRDGADSFDTSFVKTEGLHTSIVAKSKGNMSEEVKNKAKGFNSPVDDFNQPKNTLESLSGNGESSPVPAVLSKRQQKKLRQQQKLQQEEKDAYEDASFVMDNSGDYTDLNDSSFVKAEDSESDQKHSFNMLEDVNDNDGQNSRIKKPFVSARGIPKGDVTLPPHFEERLMNYKSKMKRNGYAEERIEKILKKERRHQEITYLKATSNKPCFNCRKLGHLLADCPLKINNARQETGICFKCGASDHISSRCRLNIKGYPFAKCFICKEEGHISRDCAKNNHGIYVDGGKCSLCGNVNHLKKDCPSLKKKAIETMVAVHTINDAKGIDEEILEDTEEVEEKKTIKKAKVVKF